MNRIKLFSDVFPYLAIPVLVYNLVAFFAGDTADGNAPAILATIEATVISLPMLSGVRLELSWADLLVALAVAFLFVEVVKATSTASAGIINHMLSMLLFIVCLMEFVVLESFATAPFFIITLIVLLDALAGMVVTIVSARRDFGVEGIGT
ncbi:hypothetical protein [uncultured Erythrobacter sp.]|uniref:hypothetical protein n=1 Tax=uncultured Erythrobacter sp. TaxID=263913 RepID=UPI0026351529|nr:hypothetical protein [uncultured Erythrobacter sp.]